eukprot:CAMPEP_0115279408 /NCGR_PEP_ID=MMETSP0270-20121206/58246_1 /TAXON_ID=71861 /ORGANISM="Scrippsiella trochoidea, Strain CCMP3099" /LENGTH=196 /DNA_ID=CAMNT_0002696091 /DNA_START=312 /DNA_END=901 /DNA_ORIENTATION=-
MTKEGDWWSGVVRNDSDLHLVHGQLRLRREGRCLRSNFKKDFREDWGADTFAHPGGWHRAAGKLARRQQHHIVMLQAKQAELAKQQEQAKQANCVAQSPQRPGLALGWAWLPRWATSQAPPVLSMGSVASAPAAADGADGSVAGPARHQTRQLTLLGRHHLFALGRCQLQIYSSESDGPGVLVARPLEQRYQGALS